MRSAGNFNPEWGYLAPAPSFMRTLRVILVATAIGATAGAAVVISLIDRPATAGDKTASTTAHAIVTSVQAASAAAVPPVAAAVTAAPVKTTASDLVVSPQAVASPMAQTMEAPAAAQAGAPAATATQSATIAPPQASPNMPVRESSASNVRPAAPKPADGIAALSYASPSADDERATDVPEQGLLRPEPAEKKAKRHIAGDYAANSKNNQPPTLGAFLRRIFNPRPTGTSSYYPNR